LPGPQIVVVGGEIVGRLGERALLFEIGHADRERADDLPGDVVLHREDVGGAAVIALGESRMPRPASVSWMVTRIRSSERRTLPSAT
jgi:hypothetical protein